MTCILVQRFFFALAGVAALIQMGCSSSRSTRYRVRLTQDVWVTPPNGQTVEKKKGEVFEAGNSVLIQRPGHVGVLVVPLGPTTTREVIVNLKPSQEWGGKDYQKAMNVTLNQIMSELTEIQLLLSRSQAKEALERVETLQKKYPDMTHLGFIKASCLMLLGETEQAKAVLEISLRDFPDDHAAQDLYQSLTGESLTEKVAPRDSQRSPAALPANQKGDEEK